MKDTAAAALSSTPLQASPLLNKLDFNINNPSAPQKLLDMKDLAPHILEQVTNSLKMGRSHSIGLPSTTQSQIGSQLN